jgi:hypothetical protein
MDEPEDGHRQTQDPRGGPLGQLELLERRHVPQGEVVDQFASIRPCIDGPAGRIHGPASPSPKAAPDPYIGPGGRDVRSHGRKGPASHDSGTCDVGSASRLSACRRRSYRKIGERMTVQIRRVRGSRSRARRWSTRPRRPAVAARHVEGSFGDRRLDEGDRTQPRTTPLVRASPRTVRSVRGPVSRGAPTSPKPGDPDQCGRGSPEVGSGSVSSLSGTRTVVAGAGGTEAARLISEPLVSRFMAARSQ